MNGVPQTHLDLGIIIDDVIRVASHEKDNLVKIMVMGLGYHEEWLREERPAQREVHTEEVFLPESPNLRCVNLLIERITRFQFYDVVSVTFSIGICYSFIPL